MRSTNERTDAPPADAVGLPRRAGFEAELTALLAERTQRYTMGDSTSVRTETAEQLLSSILYCIRLHLRMHPNGEASRQAGALFEAGLADARGLVRRGRLLLRQAEALRPPVENTGFRDTLAALPAFFARYDPDFFAHQIPCDIDYPLCRPVPETELGVEYVNSYLRRLLVESAFLRRFPPERLAALYESAYGGDGGLLVNLCLPAAETAVGCALCGLPPLSLAVRSADRAQIVDRLSERNETDAQAALLAAAASVCEALRFTGSAERDYLARIAAELLPRIRACAGQANREGLFPSAV